jgi:hypothetical protein
MARVLTSTLLLLVITHLLLAQQEPPEDVFNHSSRDLAFRVPPEFQLVTQNRRYLNPAAHETPRYQRIWRHGSDSIIVNVVVLPDAIWQRKTPTGIFAKSLANILSDPTLKLMSRRSYELNGCSAESITCYYDSENGTSQRMDCFLSKPYMFMLAYVSSKPSSWDDPASKTFFQTISLKPKK